MLSISRQGGLLTSPYQHKGPHSPFNGVTLGFALCDLVDVALFCRHTAGSIRQAPDRNVGGITTWRHHNPFAPKETNKNRWLIPLKLVWSPWEPLVASDMSQVDSSDHVLLGRGFGFTTSFLRPVGQSKCSVQPFGSSVLKCDGGHVRSRKS